MSPILLDVKPPDHTSGSLAECPMCNALPRTALAAQCVLWTLLPLLLAWKWVLLGDRMLTVREILSSADRAVCYLQDGLLWCVLYVVLLVPLRRGWRGWSMATIVICNLVLALQAVDVRCKLLFLQPLGPEVAYFGLTQLSSLTSSLGLFAGKAFWLAALAAQLVLNAVIPVVWMWRRLAGKRPAGWRYVLPSYITRTLRAARWTPGLASLPLLVLIACAPRQPYHLEDNVLTALLVNLVRDGRQLDPALGAACDQKVKELGGDDLAHVRDPAVAMARGRNVVLVILESVRFADSSLGDPHRNCTPFLLELSRHGPVAAPCYVQIAHSTKSIFSLLTGRYASDSLEVLESQQREIEGLVSVLQRRGYYTTFLSSQYLTFQNVRGQYNAMGFDKILGATELIEMARADGYEPALNSYGCDDGALLRGPVDGLPRDRPYLAVFYTQSTHHPYYCYPGASRQGNDLDRYRAALRYSDGVLRRLIDQFAARGDFERTVYVFIGDHGELFVDGQAAGRGTRMTEGEMCVPLVVAVPGADAEPLAARPTRNIDVVPTVLDLLGIAPAGLLVQGRSLFAEPMPLPMYMNSWGTCDVAALVEDRMKYVYDRSSASMWAYDLTVDAEMRHPLSVEPQEKAELAARLAAFCNYNEARLRSGIVP